MAEQDESDLEFVEENPRLGIASFIVLVVFALLLLLAASAFAVWTTKLVGDWLNLPAFHVLVAFLGFVVALGILLAAGRIETAIEKQIAGSLTERLAGLAEDLEMECEEDHERPPTHRNRRRRPGRRHRH